MVGAELSSLCPFYFPRLFCFVIGLRLRWQSQDDLDWTNCFPRYISSTLSYHFS